MTIALSGCFVASALANQRNASWKSQSVDTMGFKAFDERVLPHTNRSLALKKYANALPVTQ